MLLNFRIIIAFVAITGLAAGLAFGLGVAYGRGDPKVVETGLTQQQIRSLLGVGGAGAAQTGAGGAGGTGNNVTGQITAIEGGVITVQSFQGTVKVSVASSATVNKLAAGSLSDLKVGDTIVASGTRSADGTLEATAVSQSAATTQSAGNRPQANPTATP
jgi:hypothetical protein